jgi:DHA2 family multidrug resistance protein-like MFS transporter
MNSAAPRQRAAAAAVLSAMAAVVLDGGMVGLALPTIAAALGETPARTLAVVTAYQAALLMALLPCAHMAERFGCRRLFVGGLALFAGASMLAALAPSLQWLVAARFLQGLGAAAIMSLGIALLRFALGADRLGAAIAWNALTVAICSAAGPALGALVLSVAGWHWIFIATAPVAALDLVAARSLPSVPATSRSLDVAAIALHASAAGSAVLAIGLVPGSPALAAALCAAAMASGWRLLARERGKAAPLVPFDLLALRPFRASVAASVFFFTAQSAGLLVLPFYLQLGLGRSAAAAGLTLALWPLAVAATSRAANRLATRYSSASICVSGGLVLAAGLVLGASWPIADDIAPLGACAILCGVGFGLFQVPNNRTMFLSAPAGRSAAAGGMQATARLAGQTAGALLVGFVLSAAPAGTAPRLALAAAAFAALAAAWIGGAPLRSSGKAGRVGA